jgi:replication initiation and membrane attachment protein DnaB
MAVEKTKHAFVDDNPYLVYSGEPESTLDNAGGGGGDDAYANLFIIEITNSPQAMNEYTLVTPLETVKEEWQKHQAIPVIRTLFFYGGSNDYLGSWAPPSSAANTQMAGAFKVKLESNVSETKVAQEEIIVKSDGSVTYTKTYPTE